MKSSGLNSTNDELPTEPVILFDGVCNLCNGTVNFVVDRDSSHHFKMASLQSKAGQKILAQFNMPGDDFETLVLVENGIASTHSTSILRILKKLDGLWPLMSIFLLIPKPIRDGIYRWISSNRYRWFGKLDTCRIPGPELEHRFLE